MQGARALFCHIPEAISCAPAGAGTERGRAARIRLPAPIHAFSRGTRSLHRPDPPAPAALLLTAQPRPECAGVAVPQQQKSELSRTTSNTRDGTLPAQVRPKG